MGAGRFAPSPSGDFHLGNLRTYTLTWVIARVSGRRIIYRIEDIDRQRSHESAAADQMEDLASFGLDWDGEPVRQSERFSLYEAALDWLAERGWTYECYCSRKDIQEASRAPHVTPGMYPGTCRRLTAEQRHEKRTQLFSQGRHPAIRFHAHAAYATTMADAQTDAPGATSPPPWAVHEDFSTLQKYSGPVDDMVLRRGDNNWAYNLAVVVDDLTMGVDQITRGDDLLPSAPGQNFLAAMLEPWAVTMVEPSAEGGRVGAAPARVVSPSRWRYNHVPLVVTDLSTGAHGSTHSQFMRLAKRDGAVTLRELGYHTAWAWVAESLGYPECTSAPELLEAVTLARLPRQPVIWSSSSSPRHGW